MFDVSEKNVKVRQMVDNALADAFAQHPELKKTLGIEVPTEWVTEKLSYSEIQTKINKIIQSAIDELKKEQSKDKKQFEPKGDAE